MKKWRSDGWLIPYWVGVVSLVVTFMVVIYKVVFTPFCVPNVQGVCPVDGGTVVGSLLPLWD
jgi:hypothetical protein